MVRTCIAIPEPGGERAHPRPFRGYARKPLPEFWAPTPTLVPAPLRRRTRLLLHLEKPSLPQRGRHNGQGLLDDLDVRAACGDAIEQGDGFTKRCRPPA